jgi:Fibronectin type III domain
MQDIGSPARRTRLTGLLVVALLLGACSGGSSGSSTSTSATGSTTNTSSSTSTTSAATTTGSATLSWSAPTENADGTPVTNLAGYRVYYGTSASDLSQSIEVAGATTTSYVVENLPAGTYYFAVAAYDTSGTESQPSDVASKTI